MADASTTSLAGAPLSLAASSAASRRRRQLLDLTLAPQQVRDCMSPQSCPYTVVSQVERLLAHRQVQIARLPAAVLLISWCIWMRLDLDLLHPSIMGLAEIVSCS